MSTIAPDLTGSARPIVLATRGSPLAMVQTNLVLARCRAAFPMMQFEARIIKTTGDKLQTAPPDVPGMPGTKGLFTKELEVAILNGEADFAVHSLKDLPTELPDGLELSAVLARADVRDVLIFRDAGVYSATEGSATGGAVKRGLHLGASINDFPRGATLATSSTRRQAQLLALRPDLNAVAVRGNVATRLQKLADRPELDGLVLAAAGLERLRFLISTEGRLGYGLDATDKEQAPAGLLARFFSVEEMVPCVGQGAIGIEGRRGDRRLAPIYAELTDTATLQCVTAERAFLHGMGGGCLSPVAAHAQILDGRLSLRAVSFRQEKARRVQRTAVPEDAAALGAQVAADLIA